MSGIYRAAFVLLSVIVCFPAICSADYCADVSRYQPGVRMQSVHQIFTLLSGSFGKFLTIGCGVAGVLLTLLAGFAKNKEVQLRALVLLSLGVFLFVARFTIDALYFCRSFEAWRMLEQVFDWTGGALAGLLLIGIPSLLLGLFSAQAVNELVVVPLRRHLTGESPQMHWSLRNGLDLIAASIFACLLFAAGWGSSVAILVSVAAGVYIYCRKRLTRS